MDPACLTEEEISYELALRHVSSLSSLPRRARAVRLRALMKEDSSKHIYHENSSHVMDGETNIDMCQFNINELLSTLDTAFQKSDLTFIRQARSRLFHYRDRLAIIEPSTNLLDTHTSLCLLVQFALEDIDDALGKGNKSLINKQDLASMTGAIPKTTRTSAHAENESATKHTNDTLQQASPLSINHSTSLPEQETPAEPQLLDIEEIEDRYVGEKDPMNRRTARIDGTRSQRFDLLPGFDNRGWNSLEQRVHAAAAHGLNNTTHHTTLRGMRLEEIPPPPYAAPGVTPATRNQNNYERMRDEWVTNYLRPEENAVSRMQLEERRMCKAIHNWPFRYKGEKDGASLNTFLQRVEIFALSEAVPEAILLKNIKHLLLDDALTWYGNAYLKGDLVSWEAFKKLIRYEFLPSSYAFILRVEAYHRVQGEEESFHKFFQDLSTLFHYVDPPMSEQEKLFIVKKNMNTTYAPIAAAQQSTTMNQLVKACKEFDELKKLQDAQRRIPLPHAILLEPNLATPQQKQTSRNLQSTQRFGRINVMEAETVPQPTIEPIQQTPTGDSPMYPQEDWLDKIEMLTQKVDALKLQFDRRVSRPEAQVNNTSHNRTEDSATASSSNNNQRQANWVCWNCDENEHRFMDCAKPQAVLFCYRCGQKGFSLRSCPTCRQRPGNEQAGNQQ